MRQVHQLLHGRLHGLRAPLERGVFKEVEEVEQDFVQGGGEGLDLGGVEQALVSVVVGIVPIEVLRL